MMLQNTLPGFWEAMVDTAIKTLQFYAPKDGSPYYGCFSGGKDSVVIRELARMAGVPIVWHYNVTTLDPPELVRFIKTQCPDVVREKPKASFCDLVRKKGLPRRMTRWCCEKLKESKPPNGAQLVLGVRAQESARRAKTWGIATMHHTTRTLAICPIVHWKAVDVWRFIRERNIPYCSLYDDGLERIGCILCPMASAAKRQAEALRYPAMTRCVYEAGEEYFKRRTAEGSEARTYRTFSTFRDFWDWWLSGDSMPDECLGALEMWA